MPNPGSRIVEAVDVGHNATPRLVALAIVTLTMISTLHSLAAQPTTPTTAPTGSEPAPESTTAPATPDLVGALMAPLDLEAGQHARIAGTISNLGSPTDATTADVVLRTDTRADVIQTLEVPALPPGAGHDFNFTWAPPAGTHRLQLRVDPAGTINEGDETNNLATSWVHRPYAGPVDVERPVRFEHPGGGESQAPTTQSSWDNGAFRLSVRPRGNQAVVALVHKEWLDSRLEGAAMENASFTVVPRDSEDYYAFTAPVGTTTDYVLRVFEPQENRPIFGQGSLDSLLLGDRRMQVRLLERPHTATARQIIETPNGTVEAPTNHASGRLSLDFRDAFHAGQPIWIRAAWLEEMGIYRPAARHEDDTPVSARRLGEYWLLEPEHFSIIHVFNSDSEVFSKVSPQTNSEVSWDPNGGNGRMKVVANRVDTLDESMVRNFIPATQYFITAQFGITTQGNWQAMYPLILGTRADRSNPSPNDNYAAPGSFGFFYYSRDDYQNAPQIQAYYYPVGGSKQTVWTWSPAAGVYENWDVTLKIIVDASYTTFQLFDSSGNGPATSVLNSQVPLSTVDVVSFGSEDLDVDSSEPPSVGWVDGIFIVPTVGNYINQEFDGSSGWTLDGTPGAASCCTGSYLQLTSNAASQAGRAYYNLGMNAARFSAEFRFYVGPNSGGADGLTFFFYKNLAYTPADGGSLGYGDTDMTTVAGHEGYAIEIDEYANTWSTNPPFSDPSVDYLAFIRSDVTQHVYEALPANTFIDGQYHVVNVDVWDNTIAFYYDQRLVYRNTESFSRSYSGIGFSAATGGLTNYHRIDYLRVSVAATPNSPPPTPLLSSPGPGATGISTAPTLTWQGVTDPDGDPVNYLLYFGAGAPSGSPYANPTLASYTLSGLDYSTQYCWRVVAQDNKGAKSDSTGPWCFTTAAPPPTTTSPPPPPGTGLTQNWDSGSTGWTFTASSADPTWHRVSRTGRYVSPSYSLWYGRDGTGTFDNGATNYGFATSPSFVVPTSNPSLRFRSWFSTETGGYYDRRDVYLTTNGGTSWICLASSYSACASTSTGTPVALSQTMSTWVLETVGLSAYAGQTVNIRFGFNTIDSVANGYEGWYVDDVVADTIVNQAPGIPTITGPTSGFSGTSYTFSATASDDGATVRYLFDWGDGTAQTYSPYVTQGTAGSASHTWTTTGTFPVKAKAEDSASPPLQSSTWSSVVNIAISAPNSPPTACINNPSWAADGLTVTVTSCSTDPNSDPLTHTWNWGDGSPTSAGANPAPHTYPCPGGGFTITLTVSDGKASPVQTTKFVTATPPDSDADGLTNCQEITYGTNPSDADSDDDGLNDGQELTYWNGRGPTAWNTNYGPFTITNTNWWLDDFEGRATGGITSPYGANGGTLTIATDKPFSGTKSVKAVTSTANQGLYLQWSQISSRQVQVDYLIQAQVWVQSGQVRVTDEATGATLTILSAQNQWQQVAVTSKASTFGASIVFYQTGATAATYWIDDLRVGIANNLRRADADWDGLPDGLEFVPSTNNALFCHPTTGYCEYPSPTQKDVYVEVDYMQDNAVFYDFAVSANQLSTIKNRYSLVNVRMHIDQGAMGGGNQIAFKNSFNSDDWERYYNNDPGSSGFQPGRRGYYHYAIMADSEGDGCDLNPNSPSAVGLGLTGGDMFVVFRECNWMYAAALGIDESTSTMRTWMHELGHNLFGTIEPTSDAYSATDGAHEKYSDKIMWPKMNSATAYHANRVTCVGPTNVNCDIDDIGKGLDHGTGRKDFLAGSLLPLGGANIHDHEHDDRVQ